MPRTIVLNSYPVSSLGKIRGTPPTLTSQCRQWVMDCVAAGNSVYSSTTRTETSNVASDVPL